MRAQKISDNSLIGITILLAVLIVFVHFGRLVLTSNAATPFISLEAEQGTTALPAAKTADSQASGSSAVTFQNPSSTVSANNPCMGVAAPAVWKHVVVLIFENKTYSNLTAANAPYITGLQKKCGTYTNWKDANYKVNGSTDGNYSSKPNYATYTSGVPPSVHGLKDDTYVTTSGVDNIYNRLKNANKTGAVYQSGSTGSCAISNFSGAYHDPLRYYTDLGAQSSSSTSYCNTHDLSINQFMTDVNAGKLPAFSIVLPTNDQNMHNNSIASGDAWAQSFLTPFFNSNTYKAGDTAFFFLWDEDTPIPNVLVAPSIKPGSHPATPSGNPISHYSALRTWQEMTGITPLLGDTGQAPSLLNFYDGR